MSKDGLVIMIVIACGYSLLSALANRRHTYGAWQRDEHGPWRQCTRCQWINWGAASSAPSCYQPAKDMNQFEGEKAA